MIGIYHGISEKQLDVDMNGSGHGGKSSIGNANRENDDSPAH